MRCISSIVILVLAAAGCDNRPPETPADQRQAQTTTIDATPSLAPVDSVDEKVMELFAQFNELPSAEKDTLKGDKIILRIEQMLGAASSATRKKVASTVTSHNHTLIRRAMQDRSADPEPEVTGTEILGTPREQR